MDQLVILVMACGISALVGWIVAAAMFVLFSLAPQGKYRQLPIFILFVLLEVDWISIWFAAFCFLGSASSSNIAIYMIFAALLLGLIAPVSWIVFARVSIARGKLRPVLFSLERM
ncbi:hypothetical protein FAI41_04930 [Acetobacteraceae bacterium]|nr:hypothetical protein FAI41_04930 [Acetobacteraceae bacterium]